MNKLKEKLEQAIKTSAPLQKIKEHVVMTVTGEGLRVEMLEDEQGHVFRIGQSRNPPTYGKELLETLAEEIGKLPKRSRWKATRIRALCRTGGLLELGAIGRSRQRRPAMDAGAWDACRSGDAGAGFADQSLRDPSHPKDATNRRVTLIIQYQAGSRTAR